MHIRARNVATAALTAALTATITVSGFAPAQAAPASCTDVKTAKDTEAVSCIAALRTKAEAAGRKASIADEAWNQAKQAAEKADDEADSLQQASEAADRTAAASKARASAVAAAMARGGGAIGQTTEVLMSGEGAQHVLYSLSRVSALTEDAATLSNEAARDAEAAKALKVQAAAAAEQADADSAVAKHAFDAAKKTAQAAITLVQQTETKRDAQLAKQQKSVGAKAQTAYIDLPADSSTAAKVVAFARAQIGEPYVFGGAGPSTWDCSGLTMMAFQSAGIAIGGHGATVQFTTARAKGLLVPYSQAQPGDLLFWGTANDKFHVAMYSGGGNMIEAPHPGADVREVPVRTAGMTAMVARFTG